MDYDNFEIIAVTPVIQGDPATVILNGKTYTRIVRHRKDVGLYIVIDNRMYFEYEFKYV